MTLFLIKTTILSDEGGTTYPYFSRHRTAGEATLFAHGQAYRMKGDAPGYMIRVEPVETSLEAEV